jgi:hypothetical protein
MLLNSGAVRRKLCDMERAFFFLDRGHPFNGVYVASLRGPLTEALLHAGLRRLEQRHPAMRVRIEKLADDERQLYLTDEGAAPIPLRIVPRHSDDTWQDVVKENLNQRFGDDSDHLTRAVWIRGEAQSELVFGQHHVTCDALSITYAVRDLLQDLAALHDGSQAAAAARAGAAHGTALRPLPCHARKSGVPRAFRSGASRRDVDARGAVRGVSLVGV